LEKFFLQGTKDFYATTNKKDESSIKTDREKQVIATNEIKVMQNNNIAKERKKTAFPFFTPTPAFGSKNTSETRNNNNNDNDKERADRKNNACLQKNIPNKKKKKQKRE